MLAPEMKVMIMVSASVRGALLRFRGTIGLAVPHRSHATNATMQSTPTTSGASVRALVQGY